METVKPVIGHAILSTSAPSFYWCKRYARRQLSTTMQGKKVAPELAEEVNALSLVFSPRAISEKVSLGLRTVYNILAKKDSPAVEVKREEMRVNVVERVWADKDKDIMQLKTKLDMLLDGVNENVVEKAGLRDRVVSYGILFDKRQLLVGGPTQNVFSLTALLERNEVALQSSSKGDKAH